MPSGSLEWIMHMQGQTYRSLQRLDVREWPSQPELRLRSN
jgi:hypothetical protein